VAIVDLNADSPDEKVALARKETCDFIGKNFPQCLQGTTDGTEKSDASVKKALEEMTAKENIAKQEGKKEDKQDKKNMTCTQLRQRQKDSSPLSRALMGSGKELRTFLEACNTMPVSCDDDRPECKTFNGMGSAENFLTNVCSGGGQSGIGEGKHNTNTHTFTFTASCKPPAANRQLQKCEDAPHESQGADCKRLPPFCPHCDKCSRPAMRGFCPETCGVCKGVCMDTVKDLPRASFFENGRQVKCEDLAKMNEDEVKDKCRIKIVEKPGHAAFVQCPGTCSVCKHAKSMPSEELRRMCSGAQGRDGSVIRGMCPVTCGLCSGPGSNSSHLLGCSNTTDAKELWKDWKHSLLNGDMAVKKDMTGENHSWTPQNSPLPSTHCSVKLTSKAADGGASKRCAKWAEDNNYCGVFTASRNGLVDVIQTDECGTAKVALETTTCECSGSGDPQLDIKTSGPNQNCIDSDGNALPYFKMQIPKHTGGESFPSSDAKTLSDGDHMNACALAKIMALQAEVEMENAGKNVRLMTNAMKCSTTGGSRTGDSEEDLGEEELATTELLRSGRKLLARSGVSGRRGGAVESAAGMSGTFSAGRGNRAGNDEALLGDSVWAGGRRGAVFQSQSFQLTASGRGNRAGNDEM